MFSCTQEQKRSENFEAEANKVFEAEEQVQKEDKLDFKFYSNGDAKSII